MYSGFHSTPTYNVYKTNSTDFRQQASTFNSKLRTNSVASRQNFASSGASIIRPDSKAKLETGYKEDKTPKYSTFAEAKKEIRSVDSRGTKGLVGFRNLGNTCYMNSILQCLVHLPPLRDAILGIDSSDICRSSKLSGLLALAFKSLIQEIRSTNNYGVVSPQEVKFQIGKHSRMFLGYEQQDSSEFFNYLLEGLNIDLNRVSRKPAYQEMTGNTNENLRAISNRWWNYSLSRDDSVITDCFQGQQTSVITCRECGHGSVSCNTFLCLNLPSPESYLKSSDSYLRTASLEECLNLYFKDFNLQSYRCEKCKKKDSCKQKITLSRFPKILVLQLRRFLVEGAYKKRLNTEIVFPETLSLVGFKDSASEEAPGYSLYGISHHMGTLNFGHYIAECKEESRWYCFDDSRVSSIETPGRSGSAYLLFYVAV